MSESILLEYGVEQFNWMFESVLEHLFEGGWLRFEWIRGVVEC